MPTKKKLDLNLYMFITRLYAFTTRFHDFHTIHAIKPIYDESIGRDNFTKYLFLGYGLQENCACFYKNSRKLSWKI